MADFDFEEPPEIIVTPIDEMFVAYCYMDPVSRELDKAELLPLTQINNWFKAAKILNTKNITTTETGLCFFKFHKRAINFDQFQQFLEDFINTMKLDMDKIKYKLETVKKPIHSDDVKKPKKKL